MRARQTHRVAFTSRALSAHLALGLLFTALALLALAPGASAFTTRLSSASFGADGTSLSSFGNPKSLAFDQAGHRLYVLDATPPALHAFNAPSLTLPGGNFPLAVGPASGATENGSDDDIAVDNTAGGSAGNLYYVEQDPGSGVADGMVFGFDSTGSPLGGNFPINPPKLTNPYFGQQFKQFCGAAVDAGGDLWIGDADAAAARRYDSLGNSLGIIDASAQSTDQGGPCSLAFDSNGDLFLTTYGGVWKFAAPSYAARTKIDSPPSFLAALAVDTATHTLYAARQHAVYAFDAAAGAFLYEFGGDIPSSFFTGVSVDQSTGTIYVSDTGNDKVYAFGAPQTLPDATGTPTAAKNITDTGAEIGATIDDNNVLPTNWRLELSKDGGATWQTVSSGKTTGGQTGAAVSGTATGLNPNTDGYRFRVVTNKGTAAGAEIESFSLTFKTAAPPPVLSDVGAVNVADTSARLVGTIDPRNSATGYVFEYGTTPALGSSTAPVSIGGGITPITVSQVVSGLDPDTTYYFRLVATNLAATAASAGHTFTTRADPSPLPDDRAYEQVSPLDKNLGSVDKLGGVTFPRAAVAPDGQAVAFCSSALFGEPAGQQSLFCAGYLSRREGDGWRTITTAPPFCGRDFSNGDLSPQHTFLSRDFSRAAILQPESSVCPVPLLDPAAPLATDALALNLYREELGAAPSGFELLAPHLTDPASKYFGGGSEDFSHIVYVSAVNQTPQPDSPAPGAFNKVYEWQGGSLRLVSKNPGGVPFATPSSFPGGEVNGSGFVRGSAVSVQGDRIYFQNPSNQSHQAGQCTATCELYMREDGATTHDVSASECTSGCGGAELDQFQWATPAADKALFTSCAKLTDESAPPVTCGVNTPGPGAKLYRWQRDAAPGHHLVDLSLDGEPSDGAQPNVEGVVGASDDGNSVFFAAAGRLVLGQPQTTGTKLYRWRWNAGNPSVDYLGALSGSDYVNWSLNFRRVTADGRYLLLNTATPLDPVVDRDSDKDVYRWEADGGWACASCQLPGAPSAGHSYATIGTDLSRQDKSQVASDTPPIAMSDDGRVFFDTPDALVAADVNGESGCPLEDYPRFHFYGAAQIRSCQDVYEWNDGTLSLLSSGIGQHPSYLLAASSSGNDVFFFTRQRLVGWDADDGTDIYDARVGGGFPEPPAEPPACEGDACRGAATEPGAVPGAGSRVFAAPAARQTPDNCGRFSRKAKRKRAAARKAAKRGQAKRARKLRKQARNLRRRSGRCSRRAGR